MTIRYLWACLIALVPGLAAQPGCSRHGFEDERDLFLAIHAAADPGGPLENFTLSVGESLELKAVAVLENGQVQQEVLVSWVLVGDGFQQSDLSWELPASARAVFLPGSQGILTVHASYPGDDPVLQTSTASTGLIQVTGVVQPESLVSVSGDEQTGGVGQILPEPLIVQVLDQAGQPVPGIQIDFLVVQGDGTVEGESRVVSDAQGQAAVRLRMGTGVGEFSQMVRAQVVSDPSLLVDFVASTRPGAPSLLSFVVQPGGAMAGVAFDQQPVVVMLDEYQNQTHSSDPVTLEVAVGTGVLTGTTTVAMLDGVATFNGITYDIQETGVVLRAVSGALWAESQAFDVGEEVPGHCLNEDEFFVTGNGGCMQLSTGLVWSSRSPAMIWGDLAWDASLQGAFQPDASDYGRTNDLPEEDLSLCYDVCDYSISSYCHNLDEGGQTDWRMPSRDEMIQLSASFLAGNPPYLAGVTSERVFSSNGSTNSEKHCVDLVAGTDNGCATYQQFATYCVRGGRQPPDHLETLAGQLSLGVGYPARELVVGIREPDGSQVNREGVLVRIESADLGSLGGTLEAFSDKGGVARIAGWTLDTVGTVTLTISAEDLTPATHTLEVGEFPHTCVLEDDQFQTAEGGCKHLLSGLVWSQIPLDKRTWHEAVWDSESPPGNAPPDADDDGRLNDYGNSPFDETDNSLLNYCHELIEGGYSDWRLPTGDELHEVYVDQGSASHFGFATNQFFHSSITSHPSYSWNLSVNLFTGENNWDPKSFRFAVVCLRQGSKR